MESAFLTGGSDKPKATEIFKIKYDKATLKKYVADFGIDQVTQHFKDMILAVINEPDGRK